VPVDLGGCARVSTRTFGGGVTLHSTPHASVPAAALGGLRQYYIPQAKPGISPFYLHPRRDNHPTHPRCLTRRVCLRQASRPSFCAGLELPLVPSHPRPRRYQRLCCPLRIGLWSGIPWNGVTEWESQVQHYTQNSSMYLTNIL
jgi:hypothetical protein